MNFVCIVFELGDKMLPLSSMENLIVQCNLKCHETFTARCIHIVLFLSKSKSSDFGSRLRPFSAGNWKP